MKAKTADPTYEGDFQPHPMPERIASMTFLSDPYAGYPMMCAGVKTITHNHSGTALKPHKVIAIEMTGCGSFDLNPSFARAFAARLIEFAQSIEDEARKS